MKTINILIVLRTISKNKPDLITSIIYYFINKHKYHLCLCMSKGGNTLESNVISQSSPMPTNGLTPSPIYSNPKSTFALFL